MEANTGFVPGFRRVHARGVAFRGMFTATDEVAALTTAEHLQGDPIAVVVRLSNGSHNPYAADTKSATKGTALGLAVRFALPSGEVAEWAALGPNGFPAAKPDDFIALAGAQKPRRNGKPHVPRLLKFIVTHRWCVPGIKAVKRATTTESFATTRFNGLHAYFLVDAQGSRRAFRYRWIPVAGEHRLTPEQYKIMPPQYVISELKLRVEQAPVAWDLMFQMADPDDPTDDMTKHWPESRPQIKAGRLHIDRLHEDQELIDRSMFDPAKQPPGIALSDDPVLHFRSELYVGGPAPPPRRDEARRSSPSSGPVTARCRGRVLSSAE